MTKRYELKRCGIISKSVRIFILGTNLKLKGTENKYQQVTDVLNQGFLIPKF